MKVPKERTDPKLLSSLGVFGRQRFSRVWPAESEAQRGSTLRPEASKAGFSKASKRVEVHECL